MRSLVISIGYDIGSASHGSRAANRQNHAGCGTGYRQPSRRERAAGRDHSWISLPDRRQSFVKLLSSEGVWYSPYLLASRQSIPRRNSCVSQNLLSTSWFARCAKRRWNSSRMSPD